jgi:tetratricopeptide (TPR) repeat protein
MTSFLESLTELVPEPRSSLPDGDTLSARYTAIAAALAAQPSAAERAVLRQEIVALFKEADLALTQVTAFKESVKLLATQWKHVDQGTVMPTSVPTPMATPMATPEPAVASAPQADAGPGGSFSARIDHLGASTFIEKGWSKLSLGDPAGAEVALRRAMELSPADNEAETLLGWSQMMQQQYDSALLTFHNVLLRDPEHALARTNVGFICLRKQIYGEAIEHLSRAIRIDSDRKATMYAHLYLGMVYYEREMYDDAELFFQRTLELGPNMLQAWYELGRAYWFSGRRDDAMAAWREGALANKFNPWGKRCAEIVGQVEQGGSPTRRD